ncbi:hypothetical protein [Nostoc sp. PCC 7107]|uniref:hypothetical protein n=1 Tax=Nostoc sp. PCC 7107 TaxID=317936 RepID=UPI00029EE67C|nr:hypothetical protein [Nostoc sp. PCC 7107]AFY45469.1 hypothetical protein Nos7107_4951 [Nostoc sp. PCC 7107]
MLEAIKAAIAGASTIEAIEALQAQLAELAEAISQLQDEAEERQFEIEAEIEEIDSAKQAQEEAEYEAEELARTGEKERDCNVKTERGEAFITKHSKTWEILLLHSYYGEAKYLSLPASTPESEVTEKVKFYLSEWPFEIQEYCGWYGNHKIEVTVEEILQKGLEVARQEKLDLLFAHN